MDVTRLQPECISCLLKKLPYQYPETASFDQKIEYMQRVLLLLGNADRATSAPEIVFHAEEISEEIFGIRHDFSDIKFHFNEVMNAIKPIIREHIVSSSDPFLAAIQYAMIGNYIDFGAMKNVDEQMLKQMLANSSDIPVDKDELEALRRDITQGRNLTYITDNCGEIVLDMLLMEVIRTINPEIKIRVIVRGGNMLNDANMNDARQVGLDKEVPVIGNGNGVAGTCLDLLSKEALAWIDSADLLIAKGQANFETLRRCGKNIYYIFLCKCDFFAKRFDVQPLTGILVNDNRL